MRATVFSEFMFEISALNPMQEQITIASLRGQRKQLCPHHWVLWFLSRSFNFCWKPNVFPYQLGRKGQCHPAPAGYCLPQISLRISFTGGLGVSPAEQRERDTQGETEAATRSVQALRCGDEEKGSGHRELGKGPGSPVPSAATGCSSSSPKCQTHASNYRGFLRAEPPWLVPVSPSHAHNGIKCDSTAAPRSDLRCCSQ